MESVVNISENPVVLKNRGFKVILHKVDKTENGWARVYNSAQEPVLEEYWFKFTNLTLAYIDQPAPEGFGGTDALGEALQSAPMLALSKLFAMVEDMWTAGASPEPDFKYGALRQQDAEQLMYVAVVQAALFMSQGADPKAIAESGPRAIRKARKDKEEISEKMVKALTDDDEKKSDDGGESTPTAQSDGLSTGDPSSQDG